MVTTAGSASGTTATASATPKMNISMKGWPRKRPRATMMMTTTTAARASAWPTRSRFTCNGVLLVSTASSIRAILPNSVAIPVAPTTARPRP
jgi:hypothetical protein